MPILILPNTDSLASAHLADLSSYSSSKADFTVISLHDASPDYVSFNQDYLSFLSKSSLCQDAIINKFYKSYDQENFQSNIENTINETNEILNQFENNILYGDRKRFSFFISLLKNSQNYFSGLETSFGYALNKLSLDTRQLRQFFSANTNEETFKIFYRNCLGFNHRDDVITNQIDDIESIDDEEVYSITENTAVLSLTQLLNTTLFHGNNKSLTHSTNLFNQTRYNDDNKYLTFNKRDSKFINTVVGSVFNSVIHLNYFDSDILNNELNESFNIERTRNALSENVYSNEVLKTNYSFQQNTFSSDSLTNRHDDFISFDILNQDVPENYQRFMKPVLQANSAITSLGIVSEENDFQDRVPNYRGQSAKTFIQNSNIEINNILFGTNVSEENDNLSRFIQLTKKKISGARRNLSKIFFNSLDNNSSLLNFIFEKSTVNNGIKSKLGVAHTDTNNSLISRQEESTAKNLFIYDNTDVFESNNLLSSNGFTYFTRGNLEDLQNVVDIHNEEKINIESLIDNYYQQEINNSEIYKDILNFASEGVGNSLIRHNESNKFSYGNLPVHLLEEVAFITRFTGNTNHNLETLTDNQEEFKSNFVNLLYAGVNNKDAINSLLNRIPESFRSKVRVENEAILDFKDLADKIESKDIFDLLNINTPFTNTFGRSTRVNLKNFIPTIDNSQRQIPRGFTRAEVDFRRYAKDLNSSERNSDQLISPRYFTVCGIPFPDVYSSNRSYIRDIRIINDQDDLDRVSKSFEIFYKPFVGFLLKHEGDFCEVNTFHEIDKERGILSQISQEENGIIKSFIDFLQKYFIKLNINQVKTSDQNILSFISNSFEAYCNIVIAKLSQTFEYSTAMNAVKIFSEAPVDFITGIDPKDFSEQIIDILSTSNESDGTVYSSNGFLGGDDFNLTSSGRDVYKDVGPSQIQRARSLAQGGYSNFLKTPVIWSAPAGTNIGPFDIQSYRNAPLSEIRGFRLYRYENFGGDDFNIERHFIRANRRWLYPFRGQDGEQGLNGKVPRYQISINYFNKSNNQRFVNGWNDNDNQRSAIPASIDNILSTLYYQNENAKQQFLSFYRQNDFTDEILSLDDANKNFVRATGTKFTGGAFHKEIFTWNSIEANNSGINDQENNDNEYTEDLIQEADQFLYANNIKIDSILEEVQSMRFFDEEVYISYWSQYNTNYPLIHKKNYIFNVYKGLVEKSYRSLADKLESTFLPEVTSEENKDAIFNVLNKIHAGVLAEDISISYLFDAYRYAFLHLNSYKNYLESEIVNEETGEVEFNSEELQEVIDNITDLVSKHYDNPEQFEFNDYITRINSAQNSLIKFYSNNKIESLQNALSLSRRPLNNSKHFNDANIFYNAKDINKKPLSILCVGLRENSVSTLNKIVKFQISKYDSIEKKYSLPYEVKFNFNYFVSDSTGFESDVSNYIVKEYNVIDKNFIEIGNENLAIQYNHIYSFLAKKYLSIISGFGVDETSLKLDLDKTTARKAESPRVFTSDLENINNHLQTLNDDYIEMLDVSENVTSEDGEFTNILDNIDYNVENDVYTDIIDTNIKNKQDIYKRLIQFDYQNISKESLGEIFMPKEFTRVYYIPISNENFNFEDGLPRQSNNYSLKVNVIFE
jgi:hypothetical protein